MNSPNSNGCTNTSISCDDSKVCTTDTCDSNTGCVHTPINCDDSNACTTDSCDSKLGCQNILINCNDNNNCTVDTCDKVKGCLNTPLVCNDSNACTNDSCNFLTGCVYTPIDVNITCNDGTVCTTDTCDPAIGCVNTLINCTVGNTTTKGNSTLNISNPCTNVAYCDSVRGCLIKQKCNLTVSPNPPCQIQSCDNSESKCSTVQNKINSCTALIATTAAVLGVAAIAGIIIAAAVVTGGGAAAAYYGYNHVYKGEFENKNPLYEPYTKVGTNQLYNSGGGANK